MKKVFYKFLIIVFALFGVFVLYIVVDNWGTPLSVSRDYYQMEQRYQGETFGGASLARCVKDEDIVYRVVGHNAYDSKTNYYSEDGRKIGSDFRSDIWPFDEPEIDLSAYTCQELKNSDSSASVYAAPVLGISLLILVVASASLTIIFLFLILLKILLKNKAGALHLLKIYGLSLSMLATLSLLVLLTFWVLSVLI